MGQSEAGMQRYLMRVNKIRELKEQQVQKEAKVFRTGSNWKPSVTKPVMPRLSQGVVKGLRKEDYLVKCLQKPVTPFLKANR